MQALYRRAGLLAALLTTGLAFASPGAGAVSASGADAAVERGARVYERCAACHALDADRTGPRHCGLLGRRAGSVPGFPYSPAMRRSRIVWTEASLDRFLKAPLQALPGTSMGYDGVKDQGERHDLIAYLRAAGQGPRCKPPG